MILPMPVTLSRAPSTQRLKAHNQLIFIEILPATSIWSIFSTNSIEQDYTNMRWEGEIMAIENKQIIPNVQDKLNKIYHDRSVLLTEIAAMKQLLLKNIEPKIRLINDATHTLHDKAIELEIAIVSNQEMIKKSDLFNFENITDEIKTKINTHQDYLESARCNTTGIIANCGNALSIEMQFQFESILENINRLQQTLLSVNAYGFPPVDIKAAKEEDIELYNNQLNYCAKLLSIEQDRKNKLCEDIIRAKQNLLVNGEQFNIIKQHVRDHLGGLECILRAEYKARAFKYKSIKSIWAWIIAGTIVGLFGGMISLIGPQLAIPMVAITIIVALIIAGAIYAALRGEGRISTSKRIKNMIRNHELRKITDFDLAPTSAIKLEAEPLLRAVKS